MQKKSLFLILKILVSSLLIWLLSLSIDFNFSIIRLEEIKYFYLFFALVVFVMLLLNNTVRWRTVMSAIGGTMEFAATLKILYISFFFNQALPSAIGGDAFKIFLTRKSGIGLRESINGVMLERIITLLGLILLVLITQPFLMSTVKDTPLQFIFPTLAVGAIIGIYCLTWLDRLPRVMGDWKIIKGLANIALDTRIFFSSLRFSIFSIVLGITGNILISLMVYFCAKSLSIEVTVVHCLVLVPPVVLILTIPISIGGWGVREGAMIGAFGLVGISGGDAFILSISFGLANLCFSLPGVLFLISGDYKNKGQNEKKNFNDR